MGKGENVMRKHIISGICCMAIIAFLLGCDYIYIYDTQFNEGAFDNMSVQNEENPSSGKVDFQLLANTEVDTSHIRSLVGMTENIYFTYFGQRGAEDLSSTLDRVYSLNISTFIPNFADYQNRFFLITIGRELVEMKYEWLPYREPRFEMTFAEEYNANVLYLYAMDRIPMSDADMGGSHRFLLYIMQGTERVFMGHDLAALNNQ